MRPSRSSSVFLTTTRGSISSGGVVKRVSCSPKSSAKCSGGIALARRAQYVSVGVDTGLGRRGSGRTRDPLAYATDDGLGRGE